MVFLGIYLVTLLIIILSIGFVLLAAGIVLDIVWKKRSKAEKKVYLVHKIFAVLLTVLGVIGFVGPLAWLGIYKIKESVERSNTLAQVPVKIEAGADWIETGITVNGVKYEYINLINVPADMKDDMSKAVCAVMLPDDTFDVVYKLDNEMNADIIYHSSFAFAPESEVDAIRNYYENEAAMTVVIARFAGEDNNLSEEVTDITREQFMEIKALYDGEPDFEQDNANVTDSFIVKGSTSDGLYSADIKIDVIDGQMIAVHVSGEGYVRGKTVPEELSALLR